MAEKMPTQVAECRLQHQDQTEHCAVQKWSLHLTKAGNKYTEVEPALVLKSKVSFEYLIRVQGGAENFVQYLKGLLGSL